MYIHVYSKIQNENKIKIKKKEFFAKFFHLDFAYNSLKSLLKSA